MANRLKMAMVDSILQLRAQRWSVRRIARALDIDRKTVSRYVRLAEQDAKSNSPAAASDGSADLRAGAPGALPPAEDSKGAKAPTGSAAGILPPAVVQFLNRPTQPGRRSDCEPFRDLVLAKLQQGLSAQRIYQDLIAEGNFAGRYWSLRRFVQRLSGGTGLPLRRMECAAGEEAQVDFGTGAPIVGERRAPQDPVFNAAAPGRLWRGSIHHLSKRKTSFAASARWIGDGDHRPPD